MADEISYRLARGGQHYGPYTLDQLREYVRQGSVQASELVWCPGMPDWAPLADVLGSSPPPAVQPPPPPVPGMAEPGPSSGAVSATIPRPPSMHWALVLLLAVVTLGIFGLIWAILQARWVRRIDPPSRALFILLGGIALQFVIAVAAEDARSPGLELLSRLVGFATWISAYFSMRRSVERRYGLSLSGIMTFFFNTLYLQYHLRRIARGQVMPRGQTA